MYEKKDKVKIKICWQITVAAISLTTNPSPFYEEKDSPKLKDLEFAM